MTTHTLHQEQATESAGSCLLRMLFILALGGFAIFSGGAFSGGRTGCEVSQQFPPRVLQWCSLITEHSSAANLPPDLVAAVILQESGGNSQAYSRSGAVGLMQVMPRDGLAANFTCKGKPCFEDRPSTVELQNPSFNIQYGTQFLGQLINHYNGDTREALRAYGPMDMGYEYADLVLAIYQRYGKYGQHGQANSE